jgi:N-acetylmuramoyl-L-alanine amidase
VCHPDETGLFSEETLESLTRLTAWLRAEFDLESSQVIRHYDVSGKICPKYYVENEDAWLDLLAGVEAAVPTFAQ